MGARSAAAMRPHCLRGKSGAGSLPPSASTVGADPARLDPCDGLRTAAGRCSARAMGSAGTPRAPFRIADNACSGSPPLCVLRGWSLGAQFAMRSRCVSNTGGRASCWGGEPGLGNPPTCLRADGPSRCFGHVTAPAPSLEDSSGLHCGIACRSRSGNPAALEAHGAPILGAVWGLDILPTVTSPVTGSLEVLPVLGQNDRVTPPAAGIGSHPSARALSELARAVTRRFSRTSRRARFPSVPSSRKSGPSKKSGRCSERGSGKRRVAPQSKRRGTKLRCGEPALRCRGPAAGGGARGTAVARRCIEDSARRHPPSAAALAPPRCC